MTGPLRDPGPEAQRIVAEMADAARGSAVEGTAGGAGTSDPDDRRAGTTADGATADGGTTDAEQPVEPLADAPVGEVEEWSLDQLHRRASEGGLEGRWDMTRDELVAALREP